MKGKLATKPGDAHCTQASSLVNKIINDESKIAFLLPRPLRQLGMGICASPKIAQCSGTSPAAQARTSRQCVPPVCSLGALGLRGRRAANTGPFLEPWEAGSGKGLPMQLKTGRADTG